MSSVVKLEFEKELEDLKTQLSINNNGVLAAAKLTHQNTLIIQEVIINANETQSIDEKIKLLANGLQAVVTFSERYCAELKETVLRLEDKIQYLSKFSDKIDNLDKEVEKSDLGDEGKTS